MRVIVSEEVLSQWAKEYRTRMMESGFAAFKEMTFEEFVEMKKATCVLPQIA